jgi:hypothetical protein
VSDSFREGFVDINAVETVVVVECDHRQPRRQGLGSCGKSNDAGVTSVMRLNHETIIRCPGNPPKSEPKKCKSCFIFFLFFFFVFFKF